MNSRDVAYELEDFTFKMGNLVSLARAVHDAITEGPNDVKGYYGALYTLFTIAWEMEKEINKLSDEAYRAVGITTHKEGGSYEE